MLARALSILFALGCAAPTARPSAAEATAPSPPPPPDYANPSSWAAHPDTADAADTAPLGERDVRAEAPVDVFFVHPTTYYGRPWNAAFDAPEPSRFVDTLVLPHQAAAFNAAGRVFAPRYRQATIWTFTTRDELDAARGAMELAYADVLRAFDAWARGSDRPVVVAAHSQGSYHALRLLAERFETDDAMRARLVAAYLVGIPVPADVFRRTLPNIPRCAERTQTGCVLSWNTVMEGARPSRLARRLPVHYPGGAWETTANEPLTCTNPLGAREGWAPREAHRGAVLFVDEAGAPVAPRVEPALTRARCIDGVLEVERSVPFRYRRDVLARRGDLHLADYPLFFLDVRADAVRRVDAFTRGTGRAPAEGTRAPDPTRAPPPPDRTPPDRPDA